MNTPVRHLLRPIDPNNKIDTSAVAKMHYELLDWGEMAGLDRFFLERYCYRTMVKDGLMQVSLYEVDTRTAGFIAYTAYSLSFHRIALKKHALYVAFLIIISILRNPATISQLARAIRLIRSRRSEINYRKDAAAEILAIAVRPEYRTFAFINKTGFRISEELFNSAVSYFKSLGLRKIDAFVDAFNTQALLFYKNLGGVLKPCSRAGVAMYQVTFDLNRPGLE